MIPFEKSRVRVLVVDDEDSIRNMLGITLKEDGWTVELAENGKLGLEALQRASFHIVISDIQMPEMTGIQLLEAAKAKSPNTEFIIMTSNATLETAMQAIKLGAYDYLTKPFENLSVVSKKMAQVAEKILLRQQNNELLKRLRKASQDLKLLFEITSQLNGVLDEKALREIAFSWPSKLFQDSKVFCAWFEHSGSHWQLVDQTSDSHLFEENQSFESVDAIKTKLSTLRSAREVYLHYEQQPDRLFVFEALGSELADLFSHEIRTCFEKVMRYQYIVSLANRDGLTRLYNHRYFQDRLRQELSIAKRQNGDLSLILLDVDHFKKFNDTRGHPAGDQLLRELAALFDKESSRRDSDIVARYGGEEFVCLLPFTDYQGAMIKAERIRASVESKKFLTDQTESAQVTISLGVATFPLHSLAPDVLIELADKALYEAKAKGRNRVVGYEAIRKGSSGESDGARATLGSVLNNLEESGVVATPSVEEPVFPDEVPIKPVSLDEVVVEDSTLGVPPLEPAIHPLEAPPSATDNPAETLPQTAAPPSPVPAVVAEAQKPKFRRKNLGPEVDVDDLCSSLEAVLDEPSAVDSEVKAVLFSAEQEQTEKNPRGNHGTGT